MQQVNNKIVDAEIVINNRKICYAILLLKEIAIEWTLIHVNDKRKTTFQIYRDFRKSFLKRFIDSNSSETAMKKLMNLRRKKMKGQKFVTKIMNLVYQAELKDQTIKILIFRRLYSRDQNRIMLTNFIKIEMKLKIENIKIYLQRIIRLLRRKEIRKYKEMKKTKRKINCLFT